jgi:hypothetical protein
MIGSRLEWGQPREDDGCKRYCWCSALDGSWVPRPFPDLLVQFWKNKLVHHVIKDKAGQKRSPAFNQPNCWLGVCNIPFVTELNKGYQQDQAIAAKGSLLQCRSNLGQPEMIYQAFERRHGKPDDAGKVIFCTGKREEKDFTYPACRSPSAGTCVAP